MTITRPEGMPTPSVVSRSARRNTLPSRLRTRALLEVDSPSLLVAGVSVALLKLRTASPVL
jgi:hypothetical protein